MFLVRDRARLRHFARGVRRHLFWTFGAYGAGFGLTFWYREEVFAVLLAPAQDGLSPLGGMPVFIAPTEMLAATFRLMVMGGLVTAFPLVAIGAFRLLSLGLQPGEQRSAIWFFPAALVSYAAGVAFAYFALLPTGLQFLLSFGTDIATPTIRISEYMALVTAMLMWLGLVFELPLAMFVLSKFQLVSYTRFRKNRKFLWAAAAIFAMVITPTADIVTWLLLFVPLIALYELGLILAWLARPASERKPSRCRRVLGKAWSVFVFVGVAVLLPALLVGLVVAFLWYTGVLEFR